MKKALLLFLLIFQLIGFSQTDNYFHLDSLPAEQEYTVNEPSIPVLTNWKYHKGDNMQWADSAFDDSSWKFVAPNLNFDSLAPGTFETIGWFRLHIIVDTTLLNKTLAFLITQSGASEVYLDGKLIQSFGKIDQKNLANEERYDPQEVPMPIRFEKNKVHVIAIRYAYATALEDYKKNLVNAVGFDFKFADMRDAIVYKFMNSNIITAIFIFYFTFFIALSFLHFTFFLYYRANKSNLYYSIFAGAFGTFFLSIVIGKHFMFPDFTKLVSHYASMLSDFYIPALLAMLYSIFYKKMPKIFWVWIVLFSIDLIMNFLNKESKIFGLILYSIFIIESLRIIIAAIYKKLEGAWILGSGIITTVGFFAVFFILASLGIQSHFNTAGWGGVVLGLLVIYVTLSIPLSMTIYLARDFAKTSKNLSKKLIEVEDLSAKSIEQEKEKQKILETQNEVLEVQVKERTSEIEEQKKLIEEKNKDITDSINYAKRIQEAILPEQSALSTIFADSFVLFKPKDIVSGDFYWFTEHKGKKIVVAADCTGHGVPGALMSMIGCNILNKIILDEGITQPDLILDRLNEEVRTALKQKENASETRDGMDIAIITILGNELQFAGAHRPLYIITSGELKEIKANKFSIGGIQEEKRTFTNHILTLQKNDVLYLSSDGYADQFGGETGKKLMTKNFKELLLKIQRDSMKTQKQFLGNSIESWRGSREQVDDILVIGIRI